MGYWDFYYKPTKPKETKGGIKAQAKGGGKNWWAKRWMALLDSYGLGARLSRGRSYARNGQTLSITIAKGSVTAKVQGSRPKPYEVSVKMKPLAESEWGAVIEVLSGQALFAAKLLAGEMPDEIETVFALANLSLFPKTVNDIETDCSCPDWSNPCKHSAAVFILLGEEFDRDPFLLFTLRGITREELLSKLTGLGVQAQTEREEERSPAASPEPLPTATTDFWNGTSFGEVAFGEVNRPPVHAALVKRLGGFPFWRGETPLLEAMEPIYRRAGERGLAIYVNDAPGRNETRGE